MVERRRGAISLLVELPRPQSGDGATSIGIANKANPIESPDLYRAVLGAFRLHFSAPPRSEFPFIWIIGEPRPRHQIGRNVLGVWRASGLRLRHHIVNPVAHIQIGAKPPTEKTISMGYLARLPGITILPICSLGCDCVVERAGYRVYRYKNRADLTARL